MFDLHPIPDSPSDIDSTVSDQEILDAIQIHSDNSRKQLASDILHQCIRKVRAKLSEIPEFKRHYDNMDEWLKNNPTGSGHIESDINPESTAETANEAFLRHIRNDALNPPTRKRHKLCLVFCGERCDCGQRI